MQYSEIPPCPGLQPFIRCYWMLHGRAAGPPEPQRVFPDGSMEIVFHFAEPFAHQGRRQAGALLAGQVWTPIVLEPSASCDVLGIRFRPGGAAAFLPFPQQEVAGRIVSLDDVWPRIGRSLYQTTGNARSRIAALEHMLLGMRPQPALPPAFLSPRQYRRRFEAAVGIPPKLLARILRFQRSLSCIGKLPLAQVSLECGYYDQAHLVRDFRQFSGLTPSAWLGAMKNVLFVQDALEAERIS